MTRQEHIPKHRGVLYVITCASSSAPLVYKFVQVAQTSGWEVCVILTPQARNFVDAVLLEQLAGHPVRSEYKHPDELNVLPHADAIVVFPATFNTLNKWALGISDTLAVGLLSEYTGLKMPIVAVPCFKTGGGLDTNPAFLRSVRLLRRYGVQVFYEPKTRAEAEFWRMHPNINGAVTYHKESGCSCAPMARMRTSTFPPRISMSLRS